MGNRLMTHIARPILKLWNGNRGLNRTEALRVRQSLRLWTVSIAILLQLILTSTVYSQAVRFKKQAVWVFSDEISIQSKRETLIQRSADSGVDVLYVSVFQSPANASGRFMYPDDDIKDLIELAHAEGIEIWAAYGSPDWTEPDLLCNTVAQPPRPFSPLELMDNVIVYNETHSSAQFDGVALDIEPPEPQDFDTLLTLYECLLDRLKPNGLQVSVAIRFFWDDSVEFPSGAANEKEAYKHIIDMDFDNVVVMGYRDFAGTACPDDGIICLDQDEIAYADFQGKANLILVGLETQNCAPGCGPEKVTFFEEGQNVLNLQAGIVASHFGMNASFAGFAIHRYGDSYLGDLPDLDANGQQKWPPVNGGSPVDVYLLVDNSGSVPESYSVAQNYPNPFNPETTIRFQLPEASLVVLRIFNTLGQEIRMLADQQYEAGHHSVRWGAKDNNGNTVSSGIYIYQLEAGNFTQVKKMSLLR